MKIAREIIIEAVIKIIRFYQIAVSPLFGTRCRFYPSCSEYLCDSLRKSGMIKGLGKGLARVARCHPFHPGGYDPVD